MRKRDKALGADGASHGPPIDIEMLRQSTRVASASSTTHGSPGNGNNGGNGEGKHGQADMAEIQLMPVHQVGRESQSGGGGGGGNAGGGNAGGAGAGMQVHQWTPPQAAQSTGSAFTTTSLMRSGVVGVGGRGSP